MFLLFSLYALGFYHLVVGGTGILTGSPLVYPMPYTFNRPGLYLLILGVLGFSAVLEALGPFVAYGVFAILVADVAYETIRPLVSPTIQVIGASPAEIEKDLIHSFEKLSLKYTGQYPHYRVLEPYARVDVRYRQRQGVGEVRVAPRSRRSLLERLGEVIARDLDTSEKALAQRGYIVAVGVGVVLVVVAFIRLGVLIAP